MREDRIFSRPTFKSVLSTSSMIRVGISLAVRSLAFLTFFKVAAQQMISFAFASSI